MRRSRKPFRGRFLRRGFESLPLRQFHEDRTRRIRKRLIRAAFCSRGSRADQLNLTHDLRNEIVRQYRDTLVRHRRAMLKLNTAVGLRILP